MIQFKETEITQMLSTMSDGWKFEQIVNVGSHYNYTNDDHSEYLLIVSKEYGVNDHINETESSDKRKVNEKKPNKHSLIIHLRLILNSHLRKSFNNMHKIEQLKRESNSQNQ